MAGAREIKELEEQLALKEAKHEEKKKEIDSSLSEIDQVAYEIEVLEAEVRDETENVQRLDAKVQKLKLENLAVAEEIKELERSVFSQFDSTDAELSALVGQLALKEAKHEEKKREKVSTLSEIKQEAYEIKVLVAEVRDETENVQRLDADIQKWELENLALSKEIKELESLL